jgi:flagellar motor switch protein FliG
MSNLSPSIRKAAILVSTLDDRAADALLEQMGDELAARVRSALVELDDIPAAEQQAVLIEFFAGSKPASSPVAADDDGVQLDLSLAERVEQALPAEPTSPQQRRPFAFLDAVPPRETARVLARESALTIAVVIARLDPALAAELLELLPSGLATDALERMAWLEQPAEEVLADIERQLRLDLAPFQSPSRGPDSLAGMQALLGAMGADARDRMLAGLLQRNGRLARQLGYEKSAGSITASRFRMESSGKRAASAPQFLAGHPLVNPSHREANASRLPARHPAPLVEFDDLLTLSDEALRRVFAAADPKVVMLALTGAPEPLLARILGQLPATDAATLRQRLNNPGAIRLSDIEAAQEQLAAVARRLAEQGAIVLPASRHFAAAA